MNRAKKIWIISEFYYPVVTSTGYYMTEIAEHLAQKGFDVHVICMGSKYNETQDLCFKKEEKHNGVCIQRILTNNIDKNNFLKRAIRLLWASWCMFFKILLNVKKGDALLVVTNPAFLLLFIPIIKKIKKCKFYLLVHDIFPENLVAIGKLKKGTKAFRWSKYCFDRAYAKSDVCISIGRDMSEIIKEKTKGKNSIICIPNWADNDIVFPVDKKETLLYKSVKKLQGKFIFQFAGNLGHAQGLDNLLSAIKLVDNQDICFLFIGGGAKSETIKNFARSRDNIVVIGFQDRSTQTDFLNACDVSIVTLSDGMFGLGVPSKSYNIMATGKPILMIGDKESEIALCIKDYDLGWVVNPNDPVALKNTFETIYLQHENLIALGNNARLTADTVFAKNLILDKFYRLFSENMI